MINNYSLQLVIHQIRKMNKTNVPKILKILSLGNIRLT